MRTPGVGVSAIIVDGLRVVLILRARAPAAGLWSFPGGRVEMGERLVDAVRRETLEECGLDVAVEGLVDVVEVLRAEDGELHHWVVVDFLCRAVGGALEAADDAADARWVTLAESSGLQTTPRVTELAARALAMASKPRTRPVAAQD